MKKSLLFLTALVIGFASCKKDENNYYGPYTPPYHVEGVHDLTLQKRSNGFPGSAWLNFSVVYENSEQEKITLSLQGLPSGLHYMMDDSSGYPSFSTYASFIDSSAAVGDYTVKLVAKGSVSGKREFPFNVHVLPAPSCNAYIAATGFNSRTSCTTGSFMQNITVVAGSPNEVMFSNFDGSGNQVKAVVDCDNSSSSDGYFTIPQQTVNGITYSSTYGRYSINSGGVYSVYVSYTYANNTSTGSCTLSMSR